MAQRSHGSLQTYTLQKHQEVLSTMGGAKGDAYQRRRLPAELPCPLQHQR